MKNNGFVCLGKKVIQNFSEPFVIADIASNHKGDLNLAKQLIDKAVECGCDSVKFQAWSKKSLFSREIYKNNPELEKAIDDYALSLEQFAELKKHADKKGIMISASVFCKEEADFLVDRMDVPYLKVASMDINNLPLLEYIAKKGKTVILSTGMASLAEIDEAVSLIKKYNDNLILLHCVALYPAKAEQSNLNNLGLLRQNFDLPVGYSDHTLGVVVPLAAVAKGACLIEKHFALDNQDEKIWDKDFSANTVEMKQMVEESKKIVKALGSVQITLDEESLNQRKKMRRSIVAGKNLAAGSILTLGDLEFKRPGTGIEPKYASLLVGRKLKRSLEGDELVLFEDLM